MHYQLTLDDVRVTLEHVPKELVVNFMVILDFRYFDERSQATRATIGCGLLEVGIPSLYVFTEQAGIPGGVSEVLERGVNIVRQVTFRTTQVVDLGGLAVQTGFED